MSEDPPCTPKAIVATEDAACVHVFVPNTPTFLTYNQGHPFYSNSKLSRTHFLTRFLNSGVFSRHSAAASTFAGDSSFGLDSMEITERRIVSGVWTGDQRSAADS